jgi:uncharacterized OB-fold protein
MSTALSPVKKVPLEAGFFTLSESDGQSPQLLGSKCNKCGEVFFPRRHVCAKCLHRKTIDMLLSSTGTIYSYTYVHFPLMNNKERGGKREVKGYGVGQIDLPEGPRVQSILMGGPNNFRIGMRVTMELETLKQNKEGNVVVIFRVRPTNT